jgi:hypothetical protein
MADTFTSFLKIRLPQTGAYANSWGTVLNSDALALFDKSITGRTVIPLVGTTYSLAALANGSESESRYFSLQFVGAPGGAVTVTVPASVTAKQFLIDNQCGQTITFQYATGANTSVPNGLRQIIWCDQTIPGVFSIAATAVNAITLNGINASSYARLDNPQNFVAGQGVSFVPLADAGTIAVDASTSNYFRVTIGGNRTLDNPTNPRDGQTIEVHVRQDGTGSRTLAFGSKFRWPDDTPPTVTATANRMDIIVATYRQDLDRWMASIIQNYNP